MRLQSRLFHVSVALLCALTSCKQRQVKSTSDIKVAGGEVVAADDPMALSSVGIYTWFSAHDKTLTYHCGGTLIAPAVVLTAGHCLEVWPSKGYYVVLGARHKEGDLAVDKLASNPNIIAAPQELMQRHPTYNRDDYDIADLGIMKLARPAPRPFRPVSIVAPSVTLQEESLLTVASFGPTVRDGNDIGILRRLAMPYRGLDEKAPSGSKLILKGVAGAPGLTACPGDSGGSVYQVQDGKIALIGVLTGGRDGCAERGAGENINVVHDLRKTADWLESFTR